MLFCVANRSISTTSVWTPDDSNAGFLFGYSRHLLDNSLHARICWYQWNQMKSTVLWNIFLQKEGSRYQTYLKFRNLFGIRVESSMLPKHSLTCAQTHPDGTPGYNLGRRRVRRGGGRVWHGALGVVVDAIDLAAWFAQRRLNVSMLEGVISAPLCEMTLSFPESALLSERNPHLP